MWPWSTIKKLRAELKAQCSAFAKLDLSYTLLEVACEGKSAELVEAHRTNFRLSALLATAQKNDTRDPSTGRYVKADQS